MRMKKIGAVLAGSALLGATFAGMSSATELDVPDSDFYIDETTGLNNCLIVVGSSAAAADVVSASYIAAEIGTMAYTEEVSENWIEPGATYSADSAYQFEELVDNYFSGGDAAVEGAAYEGEFDDFTDSFSDPESWVTLPYACSSYDHLEWDDIAIVDASTSTDEPMWDYDLYVDPRTGMSSDLGYSTSSSDDGNFLVDTGCSFETITADFSLRDIECSSEFCTACLAACDQSYDGDLEECQTYPNIYQRHYWGVPSTYYVEGENDYCDPVGGISYRTVVDGYQGGVGSIEWVSVVVPSDSDDVKTTEDSIYSTTTPCSEAYLVCNESSPQAVDLYCDPCEVYFLGETYDALNFGTDVQGYDYMFYGTPEWYVEEKLAVGESKEYNGWELTINDLGIYENKAYVTITGPDGVAYDYVVVIDQYTSQSTSAGDGDVDVDGTCDSSGDNEENDTIAFVQGTFEAYDLCGENEYGYIDYGFYESDDESCSFTTYYPDGEVVFAVKFVKTMIGASGNYIIEYHAYDLADYGVLKEQIYSGACETPIDPAISADGLDWYFDIVPDNGILYADDDGDLSMDADEIIDLDNTVDLYAQGNSSFDISDSLTIYSDNTITLADVAGDEDMEEYFANYYLTNADGDFVDESGSVLGTSDYLVPICVPMLELWLATPVELAGLCEDELIVELEDCEGNNYFTLVVEDQDHTDYSIDTSITVSRDVLDSTDTIRTYVDLDSTMLVKLDENIDATLKESYNLILVGGPVANTIVADLVDLGETTMEMWETSDGDVVILEDVFAVGKDVLIVAGADREKTASAAISLIDAL